MVLRCSLLGHNYGEPEVDREREERGSEVVLTVTEFQACQRCSEKNVISENTEVTSIAPGDAPDRAESSPDGADGPDGSARSTLDESAAEQPSSSGFNSSRLDEEPDAGSSTGGSPPKEAVASGQPPTDAVSSADSDEIDVPTDENDEPIVDDGEILEDDADEEDAVSGDRRHGEWPDSEDVGPPVGSDSEPSAWPEDEHEPEQAVQEPEQAVADADETDARSPEFDGQPEDDAVILESGSETEPTADAGGKQFDYTVDANGNSETEADGSPDAEPVSGADGSRSAQSYETATPDQSTGPETGFASAASAPAPGEGSLPDGTRTEFFCPQCAFVAPGDTGSLRTGDICPECKKGYIGERTS